MNYYLKKRMQQHIKRSDMADMLGVNYSYYCAIERGDIKMPINLINKFNEIINRGKENEITSVENTIKADEFWEKMHQKDETGHWELANKMHDFNINNYEELVHLLGYKSVGTIYNYLQDRNPVGSEFKKRLYNFFSDEMNIQVPKRNKKRKPNCKINNPPRKPNPELDNYYNNTDFKKLMRENYITNVEIADAIGVHNSTVSNMTCKKYKPSYNIIQKVKDYLDSHTTDWKPTPQAFNSNDYISREKMLAQCSDKIANDRDKIETLQKQIADIEKDIEITIQVIQVIKSM